MTVRQVRPPPLRRQQRPKRRPRSNGSMPDPRFYHRAGPFRLADLAGRCGARLGSGTDPETLIEDIGDIDAAAPGEIIYFSDPSYVLALASSQCSACVTTEEL